MWACAGEGLTDHSSSRVITVTQTCTGNMLQWVLLRRGCLGLNYQNKDSNTKQKQATLCPPRHLPLWRGKSWCWCAVYCPADTDAESTSPCPSEWTCLCPIYRPRPPNSLTKDRGVVSHHGRISAGTGLKCWHEQNWTWLVCRHGQFGHGLYVGTGNAEKACMSARATQH